MKRSEINQIMRHADDFIREQKFHLPPFAYWTPGDWRKKGPEVKEIVQNNLGWDITDFGGGDFYSKGLFLFTIRNGSPENLETGEGKRYAEKLLVVEEGQVTPMHFHWKKMEDIINRGGGNLCVQIYNSNTREGLDENSLVVISTDGVKNAYQPGSIVTLHPGESITLPPFCYHKFWAEGSRALIGEVSLVNDDNTDNRFLEPLPRFPEIEEDEPPLHLLCTDYAAFYALT
jgi:D-lyxose ketol-isomerase